MKSVEDLIGELLLRHNCVIIPTFGGFVAKQVPAKIDFKNGTMLPPGKSLLFNRQLINNDGLLVNELSLTNGLSFDQAAVEVRQKIASWNESLKNGGRIEIDKVGRLFFDAENNLCFEQDRFYNLLLESFGLGKVHFLSEEDIEIVENTFRLIEEREKSEVQAISAEKEEAQEREPVLKTVSNTTAPAQEEQKVIAHPAIKKEGNTIWRYIAAACLLPIAFYSFWLPLKTDVLESGVLSLQDFNPFYTNEKGIYTQQRLTEVKEISESGEKASLNETINELPEETSAYSMQYEEDHFITVKLSEKENSPKEESVSEDNKEVISAQSMHFIVGCFGNKSNAQRMVKSLKKKGFDARIVDYKNGLHRVASGSAISEEGLNKIAVESKQKGHPGWVLK